MSDKKISQLDNATTPLAGTELVPMVQSGSTVKSLLSTIRSYIFNGTKDMTGGDVNINNNGAGAVRVNVGDTNDAAIIQLLRNGANYIDMPASSGSLIFRTQSGFTSRLTLATGGDLTLNTGNLVIGTSGKGIDFSADGSAAGMTSELLDDYEEGTFTPIVKGQTSAGTATYTEQVGNYTKIGNLIYFRLRVAYSGHTGTGNMIIDGLPFSTSVRGLVSTIYTRDFNSPADALYFAGFILNNEIYARVANTSAAVTNVTMTSNASIDVTITGSYTV